MKRHKWTKALPKKEGVFLWKNSLGIETLRVIHSPENWLFGLKFNSDYFAKGRHISHYSGKFCEITDFLEQIEDE